MTAQTAAARLHAFLRFATLSGGGWLLDCTLLLWLSAHMGQGMFAANLISSSVAAMTVFLIARRLVFGEQEQAAGLNVLLYATYTCGVIVLASWAIGNVATLVSSTTQHLAMQVDAATVSFIAKVLITPPQLVANFFASKILAKRLKVT